MPVDTTLAAIEKILHWLSPRFMLFVLILSACLFFMPPAWAVFLSLDKWIPAHKFWMGMGMVVSAMYLIPFGISPPIEREIGKYRANRKITKTINHLAEDEKRFLRQFYFPSHNGHIMAWPHEVGKLETDGVIFCPGDSGLKDGMLAYCLTDATQKYIRNHKEFLVELEKVNPHGY